MYSIRFKTINGEDFKEFNDRRDLILFVASNLIKDEDLISIDLGEGEIGDGIIGLANYTVDKINREKEEEKQLELYNECAGALEEAGIDILYIDRDGVIYANSKEDEYEAFKYLMDNGISCTWVNNEARIVSVDEYGEDEVTNGQ